MAPKRTSTSEAPAMTQAAIKKLVADSIVAALEAQVSNMANADNKNRNPEPREVPVARNIMPELSVTRKSSTSPSMVKL
ncbi:hypothetical protein Tco_1535489 [Tanacetum coccineum]